MINFNYPRCPEFWTDTFTSGKITNEEDGRTYELNKLQRYRCIMQLAKWGHGYVDLLATEFARDYSDADEHAKLRIEASVHSPEKKQELWASYLTPNKWKQSHFESSVCFFLNRNEREDCEHYAEEFFA